MTVNYHSDVVGSLLRPGYLKSAREAFEAGQLSASAFKEVEDRAVDQAIAMQEGAGLDVVSDGEMRRFMFMGPLSETVEGISMVEGHTMMWHDLEGNSVEWPMPFAVTGRLKRTRSMVSEEYSYARGRARKPLKMTVPSPMMLNGFWSPKHSEGAYPGGAFDMFADCVDIIREEINELARLGCEHIQIDAPELSFAIDPRAREWLMSMGVDTARMLTDGIDMLSALTDTPGVDFSLHVCRGNNEGLFMAEGGYDEIAQAVFERSRGFDSFVLEYDDERAGDFAPLSHVPDDKRVVLGLVSTKTATLETVADISSRIEDAAKYVDRDRLALCSQCGFASTLLSTQMNEQEQEAKLRLIASAAHEIWG
ncbi:MAG TPA: cobalamin-independent methionine synthase II family protein [Baekduia sp.]|nr:cobalamin-independent methionine synthase II family protein [Baekduia sp.]